MQKIEEILIGTNNNGKYKELCDLLSKPGGARRMAAALYGR